MPYKDPEKQKAAQRMWYERNKESILDKIKEHRRKVRAFVLQYKLDNSICIDCGISYPPHILDFDHLKDKRFQIGRGSKSESLESIIKEIEKCEIVCANCHRHRTWIRNKS
jgi:hypothetical protein